MKLIQQMKSVVQNDLGRYLDSARCFNATLLAEDFINDETVSAKEDECFEAAVHVSAWAVKTYSLNE